MASLTAGQTFSYVLIAKANAIGSGNVTSSVMVDRDSDTSNNGPVDSPVNVGQTCKQYDSDKNRFSCTDEFKYNSANDNNATPTQALCCVSIIRVEIMRVLLAVT